MAASLDELRARHARIMSRHQVHMRISRLLFYLIVASTLVCLFLVVRAGFAGARFECVDCVLPSGVAVLLALVLGSLFALFLGLTAREIQRGARAYVRAQRVLAHVDARIGRTSGGN